jgi:ribosomal protein S18 acetylase RimI-like enzyme
MQPHLPSGFRMRSATLDDIPAVVAVGRACNLAEIGEIDVFENWVHDEWVRPRFDPATDAWVVTEPGGAVVAATYTWDEEPHVLFDSAGWVHPGYRGRGIGTALVHVVEERAVRDLAKVPAGPAPRVLQSYDADATGAFDPDASGARGLLEGLGYSPEREYLHMQIEVSEGFDPGATPAGIEIRPRVEADDRAIVAVMADAFDDPWDYEEARREFDVSETHDPTLWLVALEHDEAVGALFGYIAEGRGQISALGVRAAWRRRGIAQAMLRSGFVMFRDRGVADVRLNVDRDNATGATRLYERAGMHLRRRWLMVAKTITPHPDPAGR